MHFPFRGRWLALCRHALALACCALAASPALAHERIGSASHAIAMVRGDAVDYYLNLSPAISALLLRAIDENSPDLLDYFSTEIEVRSWDRECPLQRLEKAPPESTGNRIVLLQFRCPHAITDLTITSHLFLDLDESHTQIVRLAPPDDPRKLLREAVLTYSERSFHIPEVRTVGSAIGDRTFAFFKLGIEHLLTGYDHILFLLAAIIGMSFLETVKAVTAFTLGHSLTMALAFLGLVSLPSAVVEPLIALTIVYVTIENLLVKDVKRRWILTGLFGLVHGLGFVGALKAITVSREELVLSLVSFNVGVETGQLLVIAVAAPVLWYLRRRAWDRRFCQAFSVSVGMLGSAWLVQRILA